MTLNDNHADDSPNINRTTHGTNNERQKKYSARYWRKPIHRVQNASIERKNMVNTTKGMSKRKFHSHLLWIVQPLLSNSCSLSLTPFIRLCYSISFGCIAEPILLPHFSWHLIFFQLLAPSLVKRLHYPTQFAWNITCAPELS